MTWAFISKNYMTSLPALRELFFSSATPDADLERFQRMLNDQSTPLKLMDLTKLRVCEPRSPFSAVSHTSNDRPQQPPPTWWPHAHSLICPQP